MLSFAKPKHINVLPYIHRHFLTSAKTTGIYVFTYSEHIETRTFAVSLAYGFSVSSLGTWLIIRNSVCIRSFTCSQSHFQMFLSLIRSHHISIKYIASVYHYQQNRWLFIANTVAVLFVSFQIRQASSSTEQIERNHCNPVKETRHTQETSNTR